MVHQWLNEQMCSRLSFARACGVPLISRLSVDSKQVPQNSG